MEKKSRLEELVNDISVIRHCFGVVWSNRNTYIKYMVIAAIASIVVSFSIPKTFSAKVMLAPENQNTASGLATLIGVDVASGNSDAYTVDLYPMLISSTDFITGLFDVRLSVSDLPEGITYYDYISNHQKIAWWGYPGKMLGKMLSSLRSGSKEKEAKPMVVRSLTGEQLGICGTIKEKIRCTVNAASGIITVTVYDQNPEVTVLIADTVVNRLNNFILDYRTSKAKSDYNYIEGMCVAARQKYVDAQTQLAEFLSTHTSIHSALFKKEQQYLENEFQLAYSGYSSLVSQLELARAKVLEATPVYTIIESAYVPLAADSPKKIVMLVLFVFFAFVIASVKVFFQENKNRK